MSASHSEVLLMKSTSVSRSASGESELLQQYAVPGTGIKSSIRIFHTQVHARAPSRNHDLVPSAQRSNYCGGIISPGHTNTQLCGTYAVVYANHSAIFCFLEFPLSTLLLSLPPCLPLRKCQPDPRVFHGCLRVWSSHPHLWGYETFCVSTL